LPGVIQYLGEFKKFCDNDVDNEDAGDCGVADVAVVWLFAMLEVHLGYWMLHFRRTFCSANHWKRNGKIYLHPLLLLAHLHIV